jgi:peptidoglycan hydrolase CwlO-like protein
LNWNFKDKNGVNSKSRNRKLNIGIAILMVFAFVSGIWNIPLSHVPYFSNSEDSYDFHLDAVAATIRELEENIRVAQEKIRIAREAEKAADDARKQSVAARQELEQRNQNLRIVLNEYDVELAQITANLAQLEVDIIHKEEEIDQAELELAEAISIKEKQYADMKMRVRYMYERNTVAYVEILLMAANLSEFLNYADYIEQLAGYDEMKMEEFIEIQRLVTELLMYLNEQRETLEEMKLVVIAEQERVSVLITETTRRIAGYRSQISQTEQEILALEAEIKRQADDRAQFERELAEQIRLRELASRQVWRDISQVEFAEGDRYLMANIIFCEAGGEPYEGQLAVGAVVMNRVLSPVFPNTITGVIYQPRQFSPVASGRLALALSQNRATASCYRAADEAMAGVTNVGNVLFFRTPIPGLTGIRIGGHIFY